MVNNTAIVSALSGSVAVTGSLLADATEETLRLPQQLNLVLTLRDDRWDDTLGAEGVAASDALLGAGIFPAQSETGG